MPDQEVIQRAVAIIASFTQKHQVPATAIRAVYGINNKIFYQFISGDGPSRADALTPFFALAEDIKKDPDGTLRRLRSKSKRWLNAAAAAPIPAASTPQSGQGLPEHETLALAGRILADKGESAAAVTAVRAAYRSAAAVNVETAYPLIPQLVYTSHRHGSPAVLSETIRHVILPVVERAPKGTRPEIYLSAAIGQLACALNESGRSTDAVQLFSMRGVQELGKDQSGPLRWCARSVLGNEAVAWTLVEGRVRQSTDRLEDIRQRYADSPEHHSVAGTVCRLLLSAKDHHGAWTVIAPAYTEIKRFLEAHFDLATGRFAGPTLPRFLHSVETLLLGTVSRAAADGDRYSAAEQEQDILLLEKLTTPPPDGLPHAPIHTGYGVSLPTVAKADALRQRLEAVCKRLASPHASPSDVEAVRSLVQRLA